MGRSNIVQTTTVPLFLEPIKHHLFPYIHSSWAITVIFLGLPINSKPKRPPIKNWENLCCYYKIIYLWVTIRQFQSISLVPVPKINCTAPHPRDQLAECVFTWAINCADLVVKSFNYWDFCHIWSEENYLILLWIKYSWDFELKLAFALFRKLDEQFPSSVARQGLS